MDPVDALSRLSGISDSATLLRDVSPHALRMAVRDGRILRARRGLYVLPVAEEAITRAAQVGGVASHLSAAMSWGWKVKTPPRRPVITVPRRAHRPGGDLEVHYADLDRGDAVNGRTTRVRTVADCARALPFDEALAVADSALRSGTVSTDEVLTAIRSGPRTGRSRALAVMAEAHPESANPLESVLRAIAIGVPGFTARPQGRVGTVGHADVVDEHLQIALEAESWEHHGLREAFNYDIRRYTAMTRLGWLVARFLWDDVMHRPAYVAAVIADLVALRSRELGAVQAD